MPVTSYEQIVKDLADILRDFQGRQYMGEIGPETLFFEDLGFVSIDAIVLAEKLEEHYHQEFPFREFLLELRNTEVLDIQIGQLAAFLHRNMKPQFIKD
jgi:acyl carrier protein